MTAGKAHLAMYKQRRIRLCTERQPKERRGCVCEESRHRKEGGGPVVGVRPKQAERRAEIKISKAKIALQFSLTTAVSLANSSSDGSTMVYVTR